MKVLHKENTVFDYHIYRTCIPICICRHGNDHGGWVGGNQGHFTKIGEVLHFPKAGDMKCG